MKETTVPQAFLSSQHRTHHKPFKTADIFIVAQKCVSRTLSRIFWQQKYFLENLLFERSALAPENFSHLFAKPDSQTDSIPRDVFTGARGRHARSSRHRKRKTRRRNDARRNACACDVILM